MEQAEFFLEWRALMRCAAPRPDPATLVGEDFRAPSETKPA